MIAGLRSGTLYGLVIVIGVAAFGWPFLLHSDAAPSVGHAADAPIVTAAVVAVAVAAVALELRSRTMNGAAIAILGVLSASAGLLRLLDLPGGGSGMFFLVILAGAAFGARFGLLLGLSAMATSALVTGGVGPWLPFQMLALAWMAAGAGVVGAVIRRWPLRTQVGVLAVYGWVWGFLYGGIMNLWFWPFVTDGGALSYLPGAPLGEVVRRYAAFYAVTSFGWDAAGALANAVLVALTGTRLLPLLRGYAGRLTPLVEFSGPAAEEEKEHAEHAEHRTEPGQRPAAIPAIPDR